MLILNTVISVLTHGLYLNLLIYGYNFNCTWMVICSCEAGLLLGDDIETRRITVFRLLSCTTLVEQKSNQTTIDDRPKPMSSHANNPAYLWEVIQQFIKHDYPSTILWAFCYIFLPLGTSNLQPCNMRSTNWNNLMFIDTNFDFKDILIKFISNCQITPPLWRDLVKIFDLEAGT